jgi:hypothetical protein
MLFDLNTSSWYADLQQKQLDISNAVQSDPYYSLDYGFQHSDFLHAVDSSFGAHVKKGVAEYLNERMSSGLNQIQIIGNQNHPCLNSIEDFNRPGKELVKIIDFYGRETALRANVPLIFIYSDGSVEKVVVVDE